MESGLRAYCLPQPPTSTSNSNHLPQPQPQFPTAYWPRHLHHPDAFVSSWYASWFQTCTCRGLCIWSRSGPGLRTLSGLGATSLLLRRPLSFSSGTLTFLKTKLTSAQGRSPSCVQQGFHLHRHQGVLEGGTLHASTSGWSIRRSTTWIIRTSVGRSTILCMYVLEKAMYHKLVALSIRWEGWLCMLIQKVDSKGWFKRLIQKVDPKVGDDSEG